MKNKEKKGNWEKENGKVPQKETRNGKYMELELVSRNMKKKIS